MQQQQTGYQHDEAQQDIIKLYCHQVPPKVVVTLAAPGTGKTTTISRLIESLLRYENSNKSMNFLVLTFTRKTKADLISKLKSIRGSQARKEILLKKVTNFHSLAARLLRNKKVIDEQAEEKVIKTIISSLYPQAKVYQLKQWFKNTLKLVHKYLSQGLDDNEWQEQIEKLKLDQRQLRYAPIIQKYKDWLKESFLQGSITYDYSLVKACEYIIRGFDRDINFSTIDLLIVDEFQDSNPVQMKMIEAILKRSQKNQIKLLMFGDFDQNIYTFRGANINYISQFLQRYQHEVKYLKNSYRMSPSVRDLSQKLITSEPLYNRLRNKYYKDYDLISRNKRDHQPQVRKFQSQISQVRWVVDKLYQHRANGIAQGDITILLRGFKNTTFYKRLKIELQRRVEVGCEQIQYDANIHYDVFKRKSIKYLMALLSYFYNRSQNKNTSNFIMKICVLIKDIGRTDEVLKRMMENQIIKRQSCHYIRRASRKKNEAWAKFFPDFQAIERIVNQKENITFEEVCLSIYQILNRSSWLDLELDKQYIKQFLSSISQFVQILDRREPIFTIVGQLMSNSTFDEQQSEIQLRKDLRSTKRPDRVQIQTIHGAKGLEYKIVFLCSLNFQYVQQDYKDEPQSFYSSENDRRNAQRQFFTSIQKKNQELRLIYTAITRTSEFSYVSSSKNDNFKFFFFVGQPNEHPQFIFLRQHSKAFFEVPYEQALDNAVQEFYLKENPKGIRRTVQINNNDHVDRMNQPMHINNQNEPIQQQIIKEEDVKLEQDLNNTNNHINPE